MKGVAHAVILQDHRVFIQDRTDRFHIDGAGAVNRGKLFVLGS